MLPIDILARLLRAYLLMSNLSVPAHDTKSSPMKIILIGYRASGKSTIGRVLSARLGYEFVDIDLEIMAKYDNKSVAEIWNEFGEPAYRETECDVTEEACQQDNVVIALGGGTAMEERAFNALQAAQVLCGLADTDVRTTWTKCQNTC